MAFKKIEKGAGYKPQAQNHIVIRRTGGRNRTGLQLAISHDVFERLGSPERVALFVGDGPDAGRVLLSPDSDGYRVVKPGGKYTGMRVVSFSAKRAGLDLSAIGSGLPFIFTSDGLRIDLPSRVSVSAAA